MGDNAADARRYALGKCNHETSHNGGKRKDHEDVPPNPAVLLAAAEFRYNGWQSGSNDGLKYDVRV